MKNQDNLFVPKQDYDNEFARLKENIRQANEAYSRLSANIDLLGLPSPLNVSLDWLHGFIDERVKAVKNNCLFDAATTARLSDGWGKIGEKAEKDVKAVERFVKSMKKNIHIDEESGMMVFNDLNELTITRVKRPLQDDCISHLQKLSELRQIVQNLRQWEKEHHIHKKPLEWLLRATEDTLKNEWIKGGMTINFEQERQEYMGAALWLRKAYEDSIV